MPAGSYMAEIQKRGRLVLGTSQDTLLFSSRNPFTGAIEGFDVDTARQVAEAIFGDPDKIQIKVIAYSDRVKQASGVDPANKVDLVADTMTINCARWKDVNFSTVYYDAGQKVLVIGASGGVGTFAVQIARAFGADVTGVCSSAKADLVRSIGADHVIDYALGDIGRGGHRYDVILDAGGSRPLRSLRRMLAPRGTLVIVGAGVVLVGVLSRLSVLVIPLVIALLVTALVEPVVTWLERIGVRRGAGSLLVLVLTLGVVGVLLGFGVAVGFSVFVGRGVAVGRGVTVGRGVRVGIGVRVAVG